MTGTADAPKLRDVASGSGDASRSRRVANVRNGSRTRSPISRAARNDASDSESEGSRASSRGDATSRGITRTRGRGTGIVRARAELRAAKDEANEQAFEQCLRDRLYRKEVPQFVLDPEETIEIRAPEDTSKLNAEELRALGGHNVANIVQVAAKSGNLKGTWVKRLKDSAHVLQEVVDTLATRTEVDETRRLRADNGRLRNEVENLKAELKAHRREFAEMKSSMAATKDSPTPTLSSDLIEDLRSSIVSSVGIMLDARFAGIEERLLPEKVHRPPLGVDRRKRVPQASQPSTVNATEQIASMTQDAPVTESSAGAPDPVAGPSRSRVTNATNWATVVRKGKKGKPASPTSEPAPAVKLAHPARPKLVSHKTAAVVVTLQSEAAEKGVTYAQIIERAEQSINLQEMGIGDGMKIRRAATGARLLELPKGQTSEQAELLASKLRVALDGLANVVRPSQSATIRVTGLDDSTTKEKIITAVVRAGNCSAESVKVGEIQLGPRGMGTVTIHCPIEVAKVLSEAGRLLVGWSAAEVQVLEQRPLRCFRCLGIGHTRPVCPSSADRGNLCYRCGVDGHRAMECTGEIRCAVCTDRGLPAAHIMGGKSCNPPATKGRTAPWAQTTTSAGRREIQEEVDMTS
ncbi:uncharacterized protein LOC120627025 [Pararge aegeria]|uniref:uncharacterized protein LOC120627025 n=1 Tax=Pararge aegeria TaxID=116150 RepID=UPI0019D20856|nr:uncharacterized protein LOC120627025 [Pararge aegeria]